MWQILQQYIQSSELEMIQSDPAASDMILQSVFKMLLDVKIDTVIMEKIEMKWKWLIATEIPCTLDLG